MVERFAIVLVALDPTRGSELQKTRPCVIVSPSEINARLRTVVIAPITSTVKNYPTSIKIDQENVRGSIQSFQALKGLLQTFVLIVPQFFIYIDHNIKLIFNFNSS